MDNLNRILLASGIAGLIAVSSSGNVPYDEPSNNPGNRVLIGVLKQRFNKSKYLRLLLTV